MICTLIKSDSDDNIKKNEMGEACRACVGKKSCLKGFGVETL